MDGDLHITRGPPALAVLPFAGGADAETALIALGLSEDVCAELTRFRSLRVFAPASAARLAEAADAEIGARIGASHVLRGRLRRAADRSLVLTANLSAVGTLTQLWSESFPLPPGDPSGTGSAVVARIAATLNTRIEEAALAQARRRPAAGLEAWELTLRGLMQLREATREADDAARKLFERALALDPLYARAHAGLALSWFNEWSCQYWESFDETRRRAYAHARRALELDDGDAMIHLVIAKVALFGAEWEQGAWYLDRALLLCPNDTDLLMQAAVLEVYLGRPEAGVAHLERAMALNPLHPNTWYPIAVFARFFARDFEGAARMRARSDEMPFVDAAAYAAAAYAQLGRVAEARAEYERFLGAYRAKIAQGAAFAPDAPVEWIFEANAFRRPEDRALLREALRRLGPGAPASAPEPGRRPASDQPIRLERSGEGWTAEFEGALVVLPDLKGLHDIRRLMERPGEEVHCLDLDERIVEAPGEAMLDATARNALKARLRDLQEDLAEAEDGNDLHRAELVREEMDTLMETLSEALGLGGRSRRLGDAAEKARTAVTWRIRHAIRRTQAANPALGQYLARRIETGTFCRFRQTA